MAQPEFLGDGTNQRRSDQQWVIHAKWLGVLQNQVGALPENNPRRSDTRRILREKINCALNSVPYTG